MTTPAEQTLAHERSHTLRPRDLKIAVVLFLLTLGSTLYAGALQLGFSNPSELWRGYAFALPLMTILLCHEMGHYVAARIHGVDVSPPFFLCRSR
jgi:Zn-dependent protease